MIRVIKRPSKRIVGVVLAGLAAAVIWAVFVYDPELETLRSEPIMQAPPDGVRLAHYEQASQEWFWGVTARVEVVWGVPDTIDNVEGWYLDMFGDRYLIESDFYEHQWRMRRDAGPFVVWGRFRLYPSPIAAEWGTRDIDQQMTESDWEGVVVHVVVANP